MVMAVSYPTNRKPILVGKPRPYMFEELKKIHNLTPSRCVMIGDTVKADIGLAKACGLKSVLVLSGVTTQYELPSPPDTLQDGIQLCGSSTDPPIVPDFYTDEVGDLITLMK